MLTQRPPRQRRPARRSWLAIVGCAAVLAGCAQRRAEPPAGPAQPVATPSPAGPVAEIPPGAVEYRIDPGLTVVDVRVYRAGPLAGLGHNHVVTSDLETGRAWLGSTPADSGFELRLPVRALVVDDPDARRRSGPEFASEVPGDAREGTRRNMLSQAVLDAERYPWLVVTGARLAGDWEAPSVEAAIRLRDATRTVDLPLEIRREPGRISATGKVRLRQSELGLTPFSVAGGAIQVADAFEVEFTVVALER